MYSPPFLRKHSSREYQLLPALPRKTADLALLYQAYDNHVIYIICTFNSVLFEPVNTTITERKYRTLITFFLGKTLYMLHYCWLYHAIGSGNTVGHLWPSCCSGRINAALFESMTPKKYG